MTIKQAIDIAIASGMTTFTIKHHTYGGKLSEQNLYTIYSYIEGYEEDVVMSIFFGNYYTTYNGQNKPYTYPRPTHCHITYRNKDEVI